MPLKLVKRHNSANWYIRGTLRGISVDESTGVSCRKQAEAIRLSRETDLFQQSLRGPETPKTFADAVCHYLEQGKAPAHLHPLLLHFGPDCPLSSIGQAEVDGAAAAICGNKSNATKVRQVYGPISAVMNHAARLKWCSKLVVSRPKLPAGRIRYATREEAERLIEVAPAHLQPFVLFLFSTGARLSEALYLDWRHVDLQRRQVTFVKTKNGEPRSVPLHPRLVEALAKLEHRSDAVFRRPDGQPYADRGGLGGGQIKTAWKTMLRAAGMANFRPHDCRHTFATWHYAANRDFTALQALGGWKTPSMVFRYAHANAGEFQLSVDRLWGETGGPSHNSTVVPFPARA